MTLMALATVKGQQPLGVFFCQDLHPALPASSPKPSHSPVLNGRVGGEELLPRGSVLPTRSLSIIEAQTFAEDFVRKLPEGTTFTSMSLLRGVRLQSDKRGRGQVIRHLQRLRLITLDGFTKEDQETRNNGFAARWRVGL